MNCVHGRKMHRTPDGVFPDDCPCSVTRRRGYADSRNGHPPAELTEDYAHGYAAGLRELDANGPAWRLR
jgi:hypothetical protein